MRLKTMGLWCGVAAIVLLVQSAAVAGVAVTYVKTLGQTNVKGQPFKTSGSRISLDKDGNLYLCGIVNNPWSMLMKLAPDGRVIWGANCAGYVDIATAVDGDHVYVVGAKQLLRRFTLAGGKMDSDWGFGHVGWSGGGVVPGPDFPSFTNPRGLIASGSYLYVVDSGRDELLRLDKATGKERPFNSRLMAIAPVDIAKAKNGKLLLLTGESVFEVDEDGNPGKGPIIDGIAGAVAIDVEPAEGKIYIAIGGTGGELVNTIKEYSAAGKPTGVKIGHGGGFSGPWSADQFAFASGRGDIAVDSASGIWVGTDGRGVLPTIVHFDRSRKQDGLLFGINGNGLAVDSDLNVYAGGSCKISWDNKPVWTSGLVAFGDLKQYPVPGPANWWFTAAYADASTMIVFNPAAQGVMALSSATGALANGPHKASPSKAVCSSGKSVFYVKDNCIEKLDVAALDKPVLFFKPSEGVKISDSGLAVSADGELRYCHVGDKIAGFKKDGAKMWEATARPPMALMKDVLWVLPPAGPGVLALDAKTGQSLGVFGNKDVDGRLPLGPSSIASGSKDGKDYLFVGGGSQIQVFEVNAE
jgi:hypothetical protein